VPFTSLTLVVVGAFQLEWRAPPDCPSTDQVRAQLEGVEGSAHATVEPSPRGLRLEVKAGSAERTLEVPNCDEAVRAAVFLIRLALPKPPAEPHPPAEAPAPPPVTWRFGVAALAGAEFATLPHPTWRFGATFRAQRDRWQAGLDVSSSPPLQISAGPTHSSSIELQAPLDVAMNVCRLFELGRVELGPCIGGGVTWLRARGQYVSNPESGSTVLWHGSAGARAELQLLTWLDLFAAASGRFGPPASIFFGASVPAVQTSPVGIETLAGVGVRF
jgi:hypothetical protein